MTTLIIKTNPARGTNVLVRDMGIIIPSDHTTPGTSDIETFTDKRNISEAGDSTDLEALLTDDAHGADSSTLILNVEGSDIPQPLIPPTLSSLAAEGTSASVDNLSAVVDPTLTDDKDAGYKTSSWWVNTASQRTFRCLDATIGVAIWREDSITPQIQSAGRQQPGENILGGILDYPGTGGLPIGEVEYMRVWLTAGVILTAMRTFVDSGANGGRAIRMGIYSQLDPEDKDLTPLTRVAQTNSVSPAAGDNGTFFDVLLTDAVKGGSGSPVPYTVPVSGYYWVANVTDNAIQLKFAVSASHRANFLPVRRHDNGTADTTLGDTTNDGGFGALLNPVSSVAYVAAVE